MLMLMRCASASSSTMIWRPAGQCLKERRQHQHCRCCAWDPRCCRGCSPSDETKSRWMVQRSLYGTNTNELFWVANVALADQFVHDHMKMSQSTCCHGSSIPHSTHPKSQLATKLRMWSDYDIRKHKLLVRMGFLLV